MTFLQIVLLFVAALFGGAMNSVAGGGTFFTFPALLFTGVLPIPAQATSAVALLPGGVAAIGAYRRELAKIPRWQIIMLAGISFIGGVLGATLLLRTSQNVFVRLVPFLLLIATLLFAFSNPITGMLRRWQLERKQSSEKTQPTFLVGIGICLFQLIIATYGGYFSGGQNILILTGLGVMGMENIHEMNAFKSLLASCINVAAVVRFILGGAVIWPQAIIMIIGAIIGGYGGAFLARKVDQRWIRLFVIAVGVVLTIYFFIKPT